MAQPEHLQKYAIKPGQVLNPGGRPRIPEEIKEARKISQFEFERIVNAYLFTPVEELEAKLSKENLPKLTAFEALVGGIIQKAIKKKDHKTAEWLLARTLGKMRERLDIGVAGGAPTSQTNVQVNVLGSLDDPSLTMEQMEELERKLKELQGVVKDQNLQFEGKVLATEALSTETLSTETLEVAGGEE